MVLIITTSLREEMDIAHSVLGTGRSSGVGKSLIKLGKIMHPFSRFCNPSWQRADIFSYKLKPGQRVVFFGLRELAYTAAEASEGTSAFLVPQGSVLVINCFYNDAPCSSLKVDLRGCAGVRGEKRVNAPRQGKAGGPCHAWSFFITGHGGLLAKGKYLSCIQKNPTI
jgi:hypothetical protein